MVMADRNTPTVKTLTASWPREDAWDGGVKDVGGLGLHEGIQ
jgi:hypothetical protein